MNRAIAKYEEYRYIVTVRAILRPSFAVVAQVGEYLMSHLQYHNLTAHITEDPASPHSCYISTFPKMIHPGYPCSL